MRSAGLDQAKSDNRRAAGRSSRRLSGLLRARCRDARDADRTMRKACRILRQCLATADSLIPLCSIFVLCVFLHPSCAGSQRFEHFAKG